MREKNENNGVSCGWQIGRRKKKKKEKRKGKEDEARKRIKRKGR